MNRALRRQQKKQQKKQMRNILEQGTPMEKLRHGAALQKDKKFKKALAYYDAVLREDAVNTDALYLKGGLLVQMKEFTNAQECLRRCLEIKEDVAPAHHNLGYACLELGEFEEAEKHLSRAHELNPQKAATKFYLEMAQKRNNNKSSPDYIKQLYEAGASLFEESLVKNLKYDAPKKLMNLINGFSTPPVRRVLDLGCGTGLMGIELEPYADEIIGVDIAENMIKEARKKNLYSELYAEPLDTYLARTEHNFDLMTAADVFIYVGPLEETFTLAHKRLEKGSLLAFTTEKLEEEWADDIWLNEETNRYRHKNSYIEKLGRKLGYEFVCLEEGTSRYEDDKPVTASYIILRRV